MRATGFSINNPALSSAWCCGRIGIVVDDAIVVVELHPAAWIEQAV
mgnify:CR=1 FL=1